MKKLQILGTGCPKCNKLAQEVKSVADEMAIDYEFIKITDITEIVSFGIMMTPGFAIDGEVKSSGKIPSREDIKQFIIGD